MNCALVHWTVSAEVCFGTSCLYSSYDNSIAPPPGCFNEKLRFQKKYTFGLAVLLGNAVEEKAPHQLDLGKIICVD